MECQGKTKGDVKCSRKVISSNYCWQHQTEEKINYNLDEETEMLVYSYLPLEEVLTIYKNGTKRNKIITRYFKKLPTIIEAMKNNQLQTVQYIKLSLYVASENGDLESAKNLTNLGAMPNIYTLNAGSASGNLELVKYLISLSIKPNKVTLDFASTSGNLELVKYLISLNMIPDTYTLNEGSRSGNLELVKYLISLGVTPSGISLEWAR